MKPTIQKNVLIDLFLIVLGIIVVLTGFQLVLNYHAHRLLKHSVVWGLNYYNWYYIHLVSSIAFVISVVIHVVLHVGWYKNLLKGNLVNYRPTLIITLLFILTSLTSFVPFVIKHVSKTKGDLSNYAFLMIELHDKMGILFTIFLILHFVRQNDSFEQIFKNIFN